MSNTETNAPEHYGQLIRGWMTQRDMPPKALAAKLGISEQMLSKQLKREKIKAETLTRYAAALGVEIRETREFVLLPAEQENALLDEILSRKSETCFVSCGPSDWKPGGKCDINGCYVSERVTPRAPTADEIEAARKDWEAEQRTGIAEAITESETGE